MDLAEGPGWVFVCLQLRPLNIRGIAIVRWSIPKTSMWPMSRKPLPLLGRRPEPDDRHDPGAPAHRVVVAACSPSTHQPIFQDMLRNAGLNKYLFEMANIHQSVHLGASSTTGGGDQKMPGTWSIWGWPGPPAAAPGVSHGAATSRPCVGRRRPGMTTALALADQGCQVIWRRAPTA